MQVGVDLLRIFFEDIQYNIDADNTECTCVLRSVTRVDVSRHQGRYESVQLLSVNLRFETAASDSDDRRSVEGSSPRQLSCPQSKERFEIYSKDESGSLN